MKRALVTVTALALAAIGGGIAYATIPGSDGVINGCYKTSDGTLRVIDREAGTTCKANETQIAWSQTGPPGTQGIQGERGPQGIQGEQGPPGESAGPVRLLWEFGPAETVPAGETASVFVPCPAGTKPVTGAYAGGGTGVFVRSSHPAGGNENPGWLYGVVNTGTDSARFEPQALCSPDVDMDFGG